MKTPSSIGILGGTRRGFSLIEVLAAVGIIGVLAALSVPTLSRMTEQGRTLKCTSNLRQWGTVIMNYVADHDGYLPSNQNMLWYAEVYTYALPGREKSPTITSTPGVATAEWQNTIYECPNAIKVDSKTAALRSYGFNLRAGDLGTQTDDKLSSIKRPAVTAMIGENEGSNDLGRTSITARHSGKCNTVFMDGHVGLVELTPSITEVNYYDKYWGVNKYESHWVD